MILKMIYYLLMFIKKKREYTNYYKQSIYSLQGFLEILRK
jgi:hypothetical protein